MEFNITLIPGDGIGPEIVQEAKKILDIYVFVLPAEKTKEEIFEEQQRNWGKLSQKEKDIVISIPNFDKAIFKEVTGIDVDRE